MISSAFIASLNIAADPWSPSNDSVATMYTLLEMSRPKNLLCLGASNASIVASMYCHSYEASLHIVEEHEAILEHIKKKGGEYMGIPTYQIADIVEEEVILEPKFLGIVGKDLDIAEEYRAKHDMLCNPPVTTQEERITSRYDKVIWDKYDFIIVDGPRKSGVGRAIPILENEVAPECTILWMNGRHDNVIEAIKYFDHDARYYDNSLSSFHLDTRDGLVITRILDEEII